MYDSFLHLLGIAEDAKIKVIRDSNPAAGYFMFIKMGGTTTDAKWPWPKTNETEDKKFPAS